MGLTKSSTGTKILKNDFSTLKNKYDFTIALAGNPNVGKSTIFNSLTGMHQHTGNWPGKTVENSSGEYSYLNKKFLFVDIPGTYSIMSNSEEEEIARDYICFGNPDATVVVVDATCLERNLNLVFQIMEITSNVIVCVNLLDEAKKKGINIDLEELSNKLGVPVVGTIAHKKKSLNKLIDTVYKVCMKKRNSEPIRIVYPDKIEEAIKKISTSLKEHTDISPFLFRWISLKLLDGEPKILSSIEKNFNLKFNEISDLHKMIDDEIFPSFKSLDITKDNLKDIIISSIIYKSEEISKDVCFFEKENYTKRDRKIDKILTSKTFGIPIMLVFLGLIFWITIIGANYPSEFLFNIFSNIQDKLLLIADYINMPTWLSDMLILGVYQTLTWVISVMLPPMAIFFPLFTFLEDLGYLARIAFNMDNFFKKCCCSGKQMITMCMGFGCNSAGVVGCRIIDSPRERLIAILTNSFVPCNGRFPFLIALSSIFIAGIYGGFTGSIVSTFVVIFLIIIGIVMTLCISNFLSHTILKGLPSSFVLELPPYRKPQFGKIFIRSIFDRTLFVLGRAIAVAAPAGLVIWLFANINFGNQSLLSLIASFIDPFASLMGMDGYILTGFILGFPANEIVLPIILMAYMGGTSLTSIEDNYQIGQILIQNGWTILTCINVMIFTILHFPCSTTILTIKKETGSWKWAFLSFIIPTACGVLFCFITTFLYNVFLL